MHVGRFENGRRSIIKVLEGVYEAGVKEEWKRWIKMLERALVNDG